MLTAKEVSIGPDELRPHLEKRLALTGGHLMLEVLQDLDSFDENKEYQDENLVTYGKRNFGHNYRFNQ